MRIGRDVPPDDPSYGTYLYGPNLWPDMPEEEFKNPIMTYREHMLRLGTETIKILAIGLPYSDDVFDDFMRDPVAAHPGQEGLQVLHPALDSWIPVPTVENTYVVNVGDVLSAWTKGQYRSALHRVNNESTTNDRYSIPFFLDGTMFAVMSPLDGSLTLQTG
ncbi:hypothetical protein A1O3_06876 [Capronia epimyces CBS 606.96]|uniref:Isopenicillin N synthase-like Fe(2+) 2OG dioxygenase domain-containing protein n=1 Tax=Capronia epimyces CBS 606.96 TaxID=1182542 RepID=W9YE56_9EURO|nr:uncharacterized protein A1O3_06876 [Capronia epimyces CBS 606.96]EXJ80594.1 hypothetical protein A1O3_06876 [Capronia epimyces CBS 606.96]